MKRFLYRLVPTMDPARISDLTQALLELATAMNSLAPRLDRLSDQLEREERRYQPHTNSVH